MRSKKHAKKARIYPMEVDNIACSHKVKTRIDSSESQDLDNPTLACFLRKKSKKRQSKCTKNMSQDSFSSKTTVVSKQVENQIPSREQDGLSLSCGTGGTKDLSMQKKVASGRQVRKPKGANAARKPEDANNLTVDDDDDDTTLACLLRNKSKKSIQATEGRRACSSSKLNKGAVLLLEAHYGNKPTINADGSEPSTSKFVEETDLHAVVAEPTNTNLEEYDLLSSFLQNKTEKRRRPKQH